MITDKSLVIWQFFEAATGFNLLLAHELKISGRKKIE